MREARVNCVCEDVCFALNTTCCARNIAPDQLKIQEFGFDERREWARRATRDELNPLVFCPCPSRWESGQPKRWGGWTIARRPPYRGYDSLGVTDADESTVSVSQQSSLSDDESVESMMVSNMKYVSLNQVFTLNIDFNQFLH